MNCKVSILCITYNQEKYIAEAIESFLMQKTSFEYEIIIHDDASTDSTENIIRSYISAYPDRIKYIREPENMYLRGIHFMLNLIEEKVHGEYIALCEGDDYWTDENKLQIQYDVLEKHRECDMCACWGSTTTEDGKMEVSQIRPISKNGILSINDVILGGGQYLVTAGLFFRKSMCNDMMGLDALDYSLQIRGAVRGGIYYIDRKMAIYRRYSKGSWTNEVLKNRDKLLLQWEKEKKLLSSFDINTQHRYHSVIGKRMRAYVDFLTQLEAHRSELVYIMKTSIRPIYIWGMGRRGKNLEQFLYNEGLTIDGVCDIINEEIGKKTEFNNVIIDTKDVLKTDGTILVSNQYAYDDLMKLSYRRRLIPVYEYMPWG